MAEKIKSRHTVSYCGLCSDMVICADCGNNCCNGSRGRSIAECDCDEAYEHQQIYWKDSSKIEFAEDLSSKKRNVILTFKDGEFWIACWGLYDLMAQGKTEQEAIDRLKITIAGQIMVDIANNRRPLHSADILDKNLFLEFLEKHKQNHV